MHRIHQKLNSQSGASILLALMLFLVCGFVAAVTLSSASNNAKKFEDQRTDQQIYLSVSSAAWMFRDIIGGMELQGKEERDSYDCYDELSDSENWRNVSPAPENPQIQNYLDPSMKALDRLYINTGDSKLVQLFAAGAYNTYLSNTTFVEKKVFNEWKKTLTITADNMYPVQADITMDIDYNITILLRAVPNGVLTNQYSLVLTFQGNKNQPPQDDSEKHCYHIGQRRVEKANGKVAWEDQKYNQPYTHSEILSTITWKETSLQKGE